MEEVVSPRGVTYNVTCHQWLRKGESSILTLPTICVHRCRVWQVSRHASKGSAGQCSAWSLCWVLLVDMIRSLLFPFFFPKSLSMQASCCTHYTSSVTQAKARKAHPCLS